MGEVMITSPRLSKKGADFLPGPCVCHGSAGIFPHVLDSAEKEWQGRRIFIVTMRFLKVLRGELFEKEGTCAVIKWEKEHICGMFPEETDWQDQVRIPPLIN